MKPEASSQPKDPRVSVVIPAYQAEGVLGDCLASVFDQTYPRDLYEVVVVNNASTDRTAEIAAEFPVRLVDEPRPGVARARNRGLTEARGELVAFIDADCIADRAWLESLVRTYDEGVAKEVPIDPAMLASLMKGMDARQKASAAARPAGRANPPADKPNPLGGAEFVVPPSGGIESAKKMKKPPEGGTTNLAAPAEGGTTNLAAPAIRSNPLAGVGGYLPGYNAQTPVQYYIAERRLLSQEMALLPLPNSDPFIITANALFVRRLALEAGGFDEVMTNGEDADLCWRLADLGHAFAFAPDAVAYHKHRTSLRALCRWMYTYGKESVYLIKKHRRRYGTHVISIDPAHYGRWLWALFRFLQPWALPGMVWERRFYGYDVLRYTCYTAGRLAGSIKYRTIVL